MIAHLKDKLPFAADHPAYLLGLLLGLDHLQDLLGHLIFGEILLWDKSGFGRSFVGRSGRLVVTKALNLFYQDRGAVEALGYLLHVDIGAEHLSDHLPLHVLKSLCDIL